jgi:SH3-like domain-containing protein
LLTGLAWAVEFKSVGTAPAVLFDAPGQKARKLFVAPAGMPVEIVLVSGDWSRVRDASGELSWIETRLLSPRRMLVVEAAQATVRAGSSESAAVIFTASKGVLLELAEPIASGWIQVRHRDGETGFVKATEVWGE